MDTRAGLDAAIETKIPSTRRKLNPCPLIRSLVTIL